MNPSLAGALACLGAAFGLAHLWRQRGWGDSSGGPDGDRKLQRDAVPAVGGLAIALGWGVGALLGAELGFGAWALAGLGLALASGSLDDIKEGGLSPLVKLVCQGLAGLALALQDPSLASIMFFVFGSMGAQNALNTFDNADGACTALVGLGLVFLGSPLGWAVLAFAIPNLVRRGGAGRGSTPWAYLGDAGSQLLGLAVLLTPGAWPILVLPALDLVHVALRRISLGLAPWRGDRRHLAHRLQRAGLGPKTVVVGLLLIAAPALVDPGPMGLVATGAAYGLCSWFTRALAEPKSGSELELPGDTSCPEGFRPG